MSRDIREIALKMGYKKSDLVPGFEESYARMRERYQHVSNYQLVEWAVLNAKRVKRRPSIMQQMALFQKD